MSKDLNDFFWEADFTFSKTFKSFAKMITQMLAQKNIIEPALKFLNGDEKSGSSGLIGQALKGLSSLFGGGTTPLPFFGAAEYMVPAFDTGGMMGSDGGKKAFPAIVHEMIGTAPQMSSLFGAKKEPTNTNIYIHAIDSQSFTEMIKKNPAGIITVVSDAMTNKTGLRQTMRVTM